MTKEVNIEFFENNIITENETSINYHKTAIPGDINDFAYSKLSHIKFFKDNYYDFDLFGKQKLTDEISIYEYQKMLCYFFILRHLPAESKILQIGKQKSEIFNFYKISQKYECWKLEETEHLTESLSLNKKDLKIYKYDNGKKFLGQSIEYFDFIFSISDFDALDFDISGTSYKNINYNLKRMLKPGGYLNLMFTVSFENGSYHLNNFLYSSFLEIFPSYYYKINYVNPNSISINGDVFIEESESNNFKYINFIKEDKICKVNVFSYNVFLQKKYAEIQRNSSYKPTYYRKIIPAYFFHHLIKCGGSSLGAVLSNWFNFHNDLYDIIDDVLGYEGDVNVFLKYKYNIENLSSDTCIRGHFQHENIFIDQRYPEIFKRPDEFKVFTFVREPMKVLYSLYYFGKKRDYDYQTISLETYLKSTKNFLAYLLNCDDSNYKEILDRYFFIGIVDRMQESFDKFASLIGKRKITVPVFNTTEKDSQIAELTPEFIAEIKKENELDYKIYNYCLEKFNKL